MKFSKVGLSLILLIPLSASAHRGQFDRNTVLDTVEKLSDASEDSKFFLKLRSVPLTVPEQEQYLFSRIMDGANLSEEAQTTAYEVIKIYVEYPDAFSQLKLALFHSTDMRLTNVSFFDGIIPPQPTTPIRNDK